MMYVLVTLYRGIIEQVTFFDSPKTAIEALSEYVKHMNAEHCDAAVYGPDGFIANAKHFLNDRDMYTENESLIQDVSSAGEKPIYLIGNPLHPLGFMVASPDDPLGYHNSAEALADLGQMRKDFGRHLKLYHAVLVDGAVAEKADLEKYIADCDVEDFDYQLIEEYLF